MIKKLDLMLLKSFFKVLFVILSVALFVMYTQNAVNWISDLAGKNIGFSSYIKLVTYLVAISATLIGYPVATLIAAVINMKELQERGEVTAMQDAGISLFRILTPILIVKIVIVVVMYFGNAFITPEANKRLFFLSHKIRTTNPILDIKEGVFYNELEGYSIKINKKSTDQKTIKDIIIYDHTDNKGNVLVTLAKSGKLTITPDEKFLILNLNNGYTYMEKSKLDNEFIKNKFIRTRFKEQKITLETKDLGIGIHKELFKDTVYTKNSILLEKDIRKMQMKIQSLKSEKLDFLKDHENFLQGLRTNNSFFNKKRVTDNTDVSYSTIKKLLESINIDELEVAINKTLDETLEHNKKLEKYVSKIVNLESEKRIYRVQHLSYILQAVAVVLVFILGASLGLMSRKGDVKIQSFIFVLLFLVYYFLIYQARYFSKEGLLNPFLAISLPFSLLFIFSIFFLRKALKGHIIKFDDLKYFINNINAKFMKLLIKSKSIKKTTIQNNN